MARTPGTVRQKLYRERHPDRVSAQQKSWREKNPDYHCQYDEAHRAEKDERQRKWAKNNPEKVAAHNAVRQALKDGILVRPITCEKCGSGGRICSHHEDYSKPLEVDWLCYKCHNRREFS